MQGRGDPDNDVMFMVAEKQLKLNINSIFAKKMSLIAKFETSIDPIKIQYLLFGPKKVESYKSL